MQRTVGELDRIYKKRKLIMNVGNIKTEVINKHHKVNEESTICVGFNLAEGR